MTTTMFHDKDCSSARNGYEELQGIVISSHYGNCNGPQTKLPLFVNTKHPNDRTPLLNVHRLSRTGRHISARILSLGILFIGGFTIGSYLLYMQDFEMPIKYVLELVSREQWEANHLSTGQHLHSENVIYVLLYHTATHSCYDLSTCISFMQNYQNAWQKRNNTDIPFNYMIGGDGRVYEARGWAIEGAQTPIRSDLSLSIAFIGNFTELPPSDEQLYGGQGLLSELKYQHKMATDYRLIGIRMRNINRRDGDALFMKTSQWKNWHEVITIQTPT